MDLQFTKKEIYYGAGVAVLTFLLLQLFKKKKTSPMVLKNYYVVPKGTPNMADALHSFEKRKSETVFPRI